MKTLGERIKFLRKQAGLTQTELGKKLNLAKSTISQYESNINQPDNEIMKSIAQIFNVTVDFLLGNDQWVIENYSGISLKENLRKTLDAFLNAVKVDNTSKDDKFENMTSLLIKKLIKEGIISPNKEIDADTMDIIKKSIEIEASMTNSGKENTK